VEAFYVIVPLVIVAILLRLLAGSMDRARIRRYIESQGGEVLRCSWSPFGPGWLGEKSDRLYEVRYRDRQGNEHRAACKTSMLTGVYFSEDHVVRPAERPPGPRVESLEEENRRLRQEVARLRREQDFRRPHGEEGIRTDES
jgi:hypothetical protein